MKLKNSNPKDIPKGYSKSEWIRKCGGYKGYFDWLKSPIVRNYPKVGRNEKCPCESCKKFKKCHVK